MMKVPPWLQNLYDYLRASSFQDLKLSSRDLAVVYNELSYEKVPKDIFSEFFRGPEHYEKELSQLAWELRLRFDPYHPYVSHHKRDLGRITLIHSVLVSGASHLFLRLLPEECEGGFFDPKNYLSLFQKHFLQVPWIICGASGVGKSTLLGQQLKKHFHNRPVVVMDRYQELLGSYPGWVYLSEQSRQSNDKGRVNSRHLLEIAFKLGAEVLVFGEIRHREISSFFHGVLSSHRRVYGTFHAASPEALWARMAMEVGEKAVKEVRECLGALFLAKDNQGRYIVKDISLPRSLC